MDSNYTYVGILLDASSSMEASRAEVIKHFNNFIDEQRKLPGRADLCISQFADTYTCFIESADIASVAHLTMETYRPYGNTALADSAMQLIQEMGDRLRGMPEEKRPANVIVLIMSDGEENASKKYSMSQLRATVEHQTLTYSWKFLFFGMEINAEKVAASMGMRGIQFTRGEIKTAGVVLNAYVVSSRLGMTGVAEKIANSRGVGTEDMKKTLREYTQSTGTSDDT